MRRDCGQMRYFWSIALLMLIAVGLAGCNSNNSPNKQNVDVGVNAYSEPRIIKTYVKREVSFDDEYQQKKRAQDLTLGGKREDGLHYIDYTNPNYMDVVIFTKRAQDYLKRNGVRKALEDFMSPDSQFVAGRLYVFAYSLNGECLADWAEPKKIGSLQNYDFITAAREAAELGGGWIEGAGVDPVDGNVCHKESYVVYADGDLIIGAGLYKKDL